MIANFHADSNLVHAARAAKAIHDRLHPDDTALPILDDASYEDLEQGVPALRSWVDTWRPDAVVSGIGGYDLAKAAGYEMPRDFSYAES